MQTDPRAREGEDALREAIAAFDESGFARLLGMKVLEAHDGFARVVMDCSGKMNPHRVAHGGAIFSLAAHAFGIAANCSGADRVAVSVHIQYIAPATGSLTAIAERVADTGNYSTFRVVVFESTRPVAVFTGVALRICPG
ncbi:MAG: PaaI family thioesterase, partial [Methanoregula sp.]|nr:PaaI family thioesterase [Methanoregula sp.]